jgi:uncharacterized membrane protein
MLPISELRGAIPFAISLGVNPLQAFAICVIGNILIVPILFLFLDILHTQFLKWDFYNKHFEKFLLKIQHRKKSVEKNYNLYGILALTLFVAIPLPLTGAWTGTLIAWLLKLNRTKSLIAIFSGIIIAGILVTLISLGIIGFLSWAI